MKGVLYFLLGVLTVSFGFDLIPNKDLSKIASISKIKVASAIKEVKKDLAKFSNSKPVKNQVALKKKQVKSNKFPVNQWVYFRNLKGKEDFSLDNARCLVKRYEVKTDFSGKKTVNYSAVCQGSLKLQNKVRLEIAQQILKREG